MIETVNGPDIVDSLSMTHALISCQIASEAIKLVTFM
jgi:hypothetical protein